MMLIIKRKAVYKAFGFKIISDIPLPELPLQVSSNHEYNSDIEIRINNLCELRNLLKDKPYQHIVQDNKVMFNIPEVGFFTIFKGNTVIVDPIQGVDEGLLRLYLLGSCMGALLMQRGILPLHGSGVVINGKVYAFVGDSGAGKSTLAAAFLNEGFKLVSDDIIAISFFHNSDIPVVIPGYPQQKLWLQSLEQLEIESNNLLPIYQRETKFSVPVLTKFSDKTMPLGGIFELVKSDCKQGEILTIKKLQKIHTLFRHTYRNFLVPRLGLMDWQFQTTTKVCNMTKLYQLSRPNVGFSTTQLISLIKSQLEENENDNKQKNFV
jgi:hypothetical protein